MSHPSTNDPNQQKQKLENLLLVNSYQRPRAQNLGQKNWRHLAVVLSCEAFGVQVVCHRSAWWST